MSWFNYPEVKLKLLNYENNTLSDLESFITQDNIDKFNLYTLNFLSDLIEIIFK